jgi:hypothetical protein
MSSWNQEEPWIITILASMCNVIKRNLGSSQYLQACVMWSRGTLDHLIPCKNVYLKSREMLWAWT